MFVVWEKWVETRTDCHIDPSSSSTRAALLSHLGFNQGSLRAQSPLSVAGSHFGILSPTDSNRPGHLVILFSYVHLLPLFFRLFTQVHLLIDGSVEGQYITFFHKENITNNTNRNHSTHINGNYDCRISSMLDPMPQELSTSESAAIIKNC